LLLNSENKLYDSNIIRYKKTNPNIPSTGYMEKQLYTLLKYNESCLNSIGQKDEKGTTTIGCRMFTIIDMSMS
jgi:hypothetical protein